MAQSALAARSGTLPTPPAALRWTVLVVLSTAGFASAYLYDCIGPLARLLSSQLRFSDADIGLIQAASSLPNLAMALIGGIIIDRIGVRKATAMLACLCLAGSITTALSPSRGGMVAGRLLYGLGSGSLSVAITIGIAKWFQGMNVSFVYGIYLTLCRLGSLAAQTSPVWARAAYGWWRTPLLLAILAGLVGLLAAMAYWVLEVRLGRRYRLGPQATRGRVLTGDLLRFSPSYWLVVLLCVTFYAGIYPFQTFAQKFFVEAQGASPYRASLLVGTPTVIAMVASPLFGLLADRIGRRSLLMLLGTALLVPIYLLMGYGHINLFIPMTLMGVAFSLVPAVMWPAVILTAPAEKLGTAFGLMSLIQSVGLGGFNLVIGWANVAGHAGQANPAGYRLGMGLFTASVLLGLGFAVLLWRRERGPAGHGLESPSGSRRVVRPA